MKKPDITVTYIDHMGSDLSVVNAARVSFDKKSEWQIGNPERKGNTSYVLSEKDTKLIKYLARHKHTSPFNHTFVTFQVKAPIFVARQLVKHKFMPWNEVSRRYVDSEPEFYVPSTLRKRAENVKQGSSQEQLNKIHDFEMDDQYSVESLLTRCAEDALAAYDMMLSNGVAPEQARMVLPQNTMTDWYWSGTLGAFADMCRLRLDDHTQLETRIVAQKISDELSRLFPVSWPALTEIK